MSPDAAAPLGFTWTGPGGASSPPLRPRWPPRPGWPPGSGSGR